MDVFFLGYQAFFVSLCCLHLSHTNSRVSLFPEVQCALSLCAGGCRSKAPCFKSAVYCTSLCTSHSCVQAVEQAQSVFLNGFVFDELPLESVRHACKHAIAHGASVFFDPGQISH